MTDTTTLEADSAPAPRRSGSLSALKLAELQGLASSLGISGTGKMRKSDLVEAIKARQGGTAAPTRTRTPRRADQPATGPATRDERGRAAATGGTEPRRDDDHPTLRAQSPEGERPAQRQRRASDGGGDAAADGEQREHAGNRRQDDTREESRQADTREESRQADTREESRQADTREESRRADTREESGSRGENGRRRQDGARERSGTREQDVQNRQDGDREGSGSREQDDQGRQPRGHGDQQRTQQNGSQGAGQQNRQGAPDDDDSRTGRRRRNRNRNRDKRRGGRPEYGDLDQGDAPIQEDDVLLPVAGILDVLDNYAFVRTSGYLPGAGDVYVPLGMVKKSGMRKGDAVTGAIRAPHDDNQSQQGNRQKYNPLVRLDSVNGMTIDEARKRPEFGKLTPLYPQERLRLETESTILTTRIIDLVAPIGKGQRGLIVAPAKAGKTMVMQALANAITTNNPEVHLMVVLVDERPEEVTDMQRAVKGEVIASTFDRPADDHTTVAELSIERAKRLVEMGHDVVVLLDSITKLGRAYNLAAPASGRILSGGVDSAALYPPKKFFGAARNIEFGGSLTILATALVETGSRMDEVIFEEFKGTGNMELRLSRDLANRRIFPAVDVNNSGTRREEILLAPEELKIMWKLRRVLAALDSQQGVELLLDRLRKTKSNYEFLVQVQQTSNIHLDDEDDS